MSERISIERQLWALENAMASINPTATDVQEGLRAVHRTLQWISRHREKIYKLMESQNG